MIGFHNKSLTFPLDEVWLADKINSIVVDEAGHWRTTLLNDIMDELKKHCKIEDDSEHEVRKNISSDTNESYQSVDEARIIEDKVEATFVQDLEESRTSYDFASLSDRQILQLINFGRLNQRDLEQKLDGNFTRAVSVRRLYLSESANIPLKDLPFQSYDYTYVYGSCCENVIGYVPVPTGFVGPLLVNEQKYFIPMSTTEGALIASTNRGCRAIFESGGITARVYKDGMTRAPVAQFPNAVKAVGMKNILDSPECLKEIKDIFDSTSKYARLQRLDADVVGRLLFFRFEATTGDAMGMNMVTKGVDAVLSKLKERYPEMEVLSLSSNYCVDKKASAINWIRGRGKSVVAEATISAKVVETVLKTNVDAMVRLGQVKLMIGSSMAGTIGGWNAHAANIVAAIFIATGQDVAQVVSSSMCLTVMEKTQLGDLYASCNMRCLEVGTIGGGTILPAQKACLKMFGCETPTSTPGECATRLAEIICSAVLAGELSLLAAQCSNDLVISHMRLNRSTRSLLESVDSRPQELQSNVATREFDRKRKVKTTVVLPEHSTKDRSVKLEIDCSNIL